MFSIYQPRPYCVSQCFFITFSILGGAIYFRELEAFTWQQWVVFLLSLCVTLLGVIVLSLRMGGNSKPAVSMGAPSPSPLKEGNANAKEGNNNFRDNATLTGDDDDGGGGGGGGAAPRTPRAHSERAMKTPPLRGVGSAGRVRAGGSAGRLRKSSLIQAVAAGAKQVLTPPPVRTPVKPDTPPTPGGGGDPADAAFPPARLTITKASPGSGGGNKAAADGGGGGGGGGARPSSGKLRATLDLEGSGAAAMLERARAAKEGAADLRFTEAGGGHGSGEGAAVASAAPIRAAPALVGMGVGIAVVGAVAGDLVAEAGHLVGAGLKSIKNTLVPSSSEDSRGGKGSSLATAAAPVAGQASSRRVMPVKSNDSRHDDAADANGNNVVVVAKSLPACASMSQVEMQGIEQGK